MSAYLLSRFNEVISLLPYSLRTQAARLPDAHQCSAEEIRLRAGRPPTVAGPDREKSLGGDAVRPEDIAYVLEQATRVSMHSAVEALRAGFVTVQGGHRVGVCGTAAMRDGEIHMIRSPSSLAIRIAKEFPGVAAPVVPSLFEKGRFMSTLLLSEPGQGKTTLLRDMVRTLSDGGLRIGVADERSEIAALTAGRPQFDVGAHTDIIEGAPKSQAMLMLLRTMSPSVLAVDEITAAADVAAVESAANCGVALLATVHAASISDLRMRPALAQLLERGVFRRAVRIVRTGAGRRYEVLETGVGA